MKRKQKGIGVVMLAFIMAVIATAITQALPLLEQNRINDDARALKKQVEFLWESIKTYQADRFNAGLSPNDITSLPRDVDALMPNYLQSCTLINFQNGQCKRIDYTPLGERITIERRFVTLGTGNVVPGMRIVIPFKNEPSQHVLNTYVSMLADLPNGQFNTADQEFTIEFGRVGSEVEHESLVKRNGESTLTGETWDTGGNTGIFNIKGLFLRNQDGTQSSVAAGLKRNVVAVDKQRFALHSCPDGHTPDLDVSVKSIQPFTNSNRFGSISSFVPRYERIGSEWVVYLDYYAKRLSDDKWVILHDGLINVNFICKEA